LFYLAYSLKCSFPMKMLLLKLMYIQKLFLLVVLKERRQSRPYQSLKSMFNSQPFSFSSLIKSNFLTETNIQKFLSTQCSVPFKSILPYIINSSCQASRHFHCRLLESCNTNVAKCNLGKDKIMPMCLGALSSNLQPLGWLLYPHGFELIFADFLAA